MGRTPRRAAPSIKERPCELPCAVDGHLSVLFLQIVIAANPVQRVCVSIDVLPFPLWRSPRPESAGAREGRGKVKSIRRADGRQRATQSLDP